MEKKLFKIIRERKRDELELDITDVINQLGFSEEDVREVLELVEKTDGISTEDDCYFCGEEEFNNGDICYFCIDEGCSTCRELGVISVSFCKNKDCSNYGDRFLRGERSDFFL